MKVKFLPSGEEHEIEFNETILHLAQRVGLHIQSVCKGIPSCAECRIQIVEGEHHVLPPSKKEVDLIGTAHYVDRSRLSCQLRCFGDVIVDLKEQIEKQERMKEKPNDRFQRNDGEKSKAILGGIFDNVVAGDVELTEERAEEVEVVEVEAVKGQPSLDKKDAFYGEFYKGKSKNQNGKGKNRNRNNNNRKGPNNQGGSNGGGGRPEQSGQQAQAQGEGGGPNKKRNRRRRRKKGGGKPSEASTGNS